MYGRLPIIVLRLYVVHTYKATVSERLDEFQLGFTKHIKQIPFSVARCYTQVQSHDYFKYFSYTKGYFFPN